VYFPWAKENRGDRGYSAADIMSSRQSEKEEIEMRGSHPQQTLEDITAINSIKERDVVYEGVQNGDAKRQISGNSVDIRVSGNGQDGSHDR